MTIHAEWNELQRRLRKLLDIDAQDAVRQVRQVESQKFGHGNVSLLQATFFVDAGNELRDQALVEEGLGLFRLLQEKHPNDTSIGYNVANALVSLAGANTETPVWIEHRDSTRKSRAEARLLYWKAALDSRASTEIRTQAWTNLGNQLAQSFRLGEAHDARIRALDLDPTNGVAAGQGAKDLMWFFNQGGCSEGTRSEAARLATIAVQNQARVHEFVGENYARTLGDWASTYAPVPPKTPHTDAFVRWLEQERLTLAPATEHVDPSLGKIDWLMLESIAGHGDYSGKPPAVFAMFNIIKSDFIVARDLLWRSQNDSNWVDTGRFADTLDHGVYGPEISAIVLAHRSAIDILDKVAVVANHYFQIGEDPISFYFHTLWRLKNGELKATVKAAIQNGARSLYGLVELADDYGAKGGILRAHKDFRNAGTHRFVVLHDVVDPKNVCDESGMEHYTLQIFSEDALSALRLARAAIQVLWFSIRQNETKRDHESAEASGTLIVPNFEG